jgi:hypothetical protein
VFKIPFGKVSSKVFLKLSGLYFPRHFYKFILIGCIPALFSLLGLIAGYSILEILVLDYSKITFSQAVFSITPAL